MNLFTAFFHDLRRLHTCPIIVRLDFPLAFLSAILASTCFAADEQPKEQPRYAHPIRGTVYLDKNGNGIHDKRERGLAGIAVSDGMDVVFTDKWGAYHLPNTETNAVFVFIH